MERMVDDLRDSESCEPATLDSLEAAVKRGNYLDVAQFYRQRTRPDQFAAFIKAELDPPDIAESQVHQAILRIGFRGLITTNFDTVFERQSDLLVPLVYPQCLDDVDGFRRQGFFAKIHGCVRMTPNMAENLVLTEDSYRSLRSNPKYQTILRSCIVMHPILTAGFSLQDPDFLGLTSDLRESLGSSMPTIYCLMRDPGHKAREDWLAQGVQIIPYNSHSDLVGFFQELLELSEEKHPAPSVPSVSKLSELDVSALADQWGRAQTLDDATGLLQEQMDGAEPHEKEALLFRLLAIVAEDGEVRLAPHLVELANEAADAALTRIFARVEESGTFHRLRPDPMLRTLREWVKGHWQGFAQRGSTHTFAWLLSEAWNGEHGRKLTFDQLMKDVLSGKEISRLPDLYAACDGIAWAQQAIEEVVFAHDFVQGEKHAESWRKSPEQATREEIQQRKFREKAHTRSYTTMEDLVAEAERLDASLGDEAYPEFTTCVAEHLIEEFVHSSHLTLHGSSDLYDPDRSAEIVDALAVLRTKRCQTAVFRAVYRWPERMRGLLSLSEDLRALERGLLEPLWWRFSSDTRIDCLESRARPDPHGISLRTGQEFLLCDLMGLTYDIDCHFRRAFNATLGTFRTSGEEQRYEPRALQELWRERDLSYRVTDEVPPELVRRVAVTRKDWDNAQPASVRWDEARQRAESAFDNGDLTQWISKERGDWGIDNLLGAYFPSKVEVVLYAGMIDLAAKELRLDEDSLSTIVFMHETVHAFCHIGRDHDGLYWSTFALPSPQAPEATPSVAHEALAQYYTARLVRELEDKPLMDTFLTLEESCCDVYRAWRSAEDYGLEQMRELLVKWRRTAEQWPPR